jgi:hypothetical protein
LVEKNQRLLRLPILSALRRPAAVDRCSELVPAGPAHLGRDVRA